MGAKLSPEAFGLAFRKARKRSPRATTPPMPLPDVVAPEGTRVMGFDLGLRLGWALLDHKGDRLASGTLRLDRYPGPGLRANQAGLRLSSLFTSHRPTHVAYELVRRHEGVEAAHVYGGLQWTLLAASPEVPETVEVSAAKRIATGRGIATKEEMLAAARVRWGHDIQDDNEADALFIAEVLRRRVAQRA